MTSQRKRCFAKQLPIGWVPAEKEIMYVSPTVVGSKLCSRVIVRAVAEKQRLALVEFQYGTKRWDRHVSFDELRPIPKEHSED